MADDTSSNQSKKVLYLTFIFTAIGVIGPIAWEWYKSVASIELQYLSALAVVEQQSTLKKLEIYYDKQPITAISKLSFALVNTGRKPIEEKDLKEKPRLIFAKDAQLLDIQLETSIPENLSPILRLDKLTNSIQISFPLLNPGDTIQFSVLTAGQPPDFHAEARIVGIKNLDVVDRVKEFKGGRKKIPWTVYPVGLFTLLSLAIVLKALSQFPSIWRYRISFMRRGPKIPKCASVQQYQEFETSLKKAGFLSTKELLPLTSFVKTLSADTPATADQQKQFEQITGKILYSVVGSEAVFIVFVLLTLTGLNYIDTNII